MRCQGSREVYIIKSFMLCTSYQILLGDQIKKNKMGGACGTYEARKGTYRVLVRRPKGRRPLGRPRHSW
jgi:hypothetical protein